MYLSKNQLTNSRTFGPEETNVPAQHSLNEVNGNPRALNPGILESLNCSPAIKPGFTLKVLVVERHLLLEDLLEPRHRHFAKCILRHELNAFNTENSANIRKPNAIFRRNR